MQMQGQLWYSTRVNFDTAFKPLGSGLADVDPTKSPTNRSPSASP
uniref:Uncharacterized protein n=1 Tax=Arundo donax TaxID=35708 RepID=A0A0A8Y7E5_ARUDO